MLKRKAFTLVELLVVIAIIGLLATLSVIALNSARAKSRDAKRVADVKQISTALELFFNDAGRYPTDLEWASGSLEYNGQTYLSIIPSAPTPADGSCDSTTNSFSYTQDNSGESYTLTFCTGGVVGSLTAGELCATPGGMAGCGGGGGCILDCTNKNCGDDGCGGSCGVCTGNDVCTNGTCTTPPFACGDSVSYGGESYPTVLIGAQCWFAKNLNVGDMVTGVTPQSNNAIVEKYCYNDDASHECATYGGLYQWDEAMQYSVTEGAQGICPDGWHIPTDAEQNTLDQGLNDTTCNANRILAWDCANAGTKLQAGGTSHFEGLLAGYRNTNGSFNDQGTYALFWSSTISGPDAWDRLLYTGYATVRRGHDDRAYGFSVRCLQD
ncbi:MAG TPA: FISUMP domain-containing protein [bacterium]|nr:FISUMP domain-containing protein [bacterium]HPT29520.1 FISUMP domain-containing protein [bacterium]